MSEIAALESEPRSAAAPALIRSLLSRREYGVGLILFLTILAASIINPRFASAENLRDLLVRCVPAAIVGCGMLLVIVTGEIDISVGSLTGLLAIVAGLLTSSDHLNWPVLPAICVVLALGTAVGLLNGVLVAYCRIPSIIVTLGMLTALRGVATILTGGDWIQDLPDNLRVLGIGRILGVPISVWTALAVVLVTIGLVRYTPIGRRIYACGSNASAAGLIGISPARIKLLVFAVTGLLVGIATLVSQTQLTTFDPDIGRDFELLVVTCVVVGGASVSGGKGTVIGMLLGVALMTCIKTVLIFSRLSESAAFWEKAVQGMFILAAVLVDHFASKKGERT